MNPETVLAMPHDEREALPIEQVRMFLDRQRAPTDWGTEPEALRFALRTWIIAELTRRRMAEVCDRVGLSNNW